MEKSFVLISPKFGDEGQLSILPPLGLMYMSSVLNKYGIRTYIVDGVAGNINVRKIIGIVRHQKPTHVGISMMTCQVYSGIKIAEAIKRFDDNIITIAGGSHVSATKGEVLKFTDAFDFLIYGEGEDTILELIKGKPLKSIKGLVYRQEGEWNANGPRLHCYNLDKLPYPDFSKIRSEDYRNHLSGGRININIMTSRGCPFRCNYCGISNTHGRKVRRRSVGNVVHEIETNMKKYGRKYVKFSDASFTSDRDYVIELCRKIIGRGLRISWRCSTRVDIVDDEMLGLMKSSGCEMINFGIESVNQETLDYLNKGYDTARIKKALCLCKKHGIKTIGYFMIGSKNETPKSARRTVEIAKRMNLNACQISIVNALPGTEIFNRNIDTDALSINRYENIYKSQMQPYEVCALENPQFSIKEQVRISKKGMQSFYLRPKFLWDSLLKTQSLIDFRRKLVVLLRFVFG